MSFFADAGDAVLDNTADRLINDIIPGGNGFIGGAVQTGVDQFANNDINREFGGGLGSEGGYGGGYGGGGGGGIF